MSEPAEIYVTKSDFAYRRVRELILSGQLEPGTVLNQATLARTIGISTTPLREALRRLKADPATSAIPVVVVSIVDEPARAADLGAAAYLVKPVSRHDLLDALAAVGAVAGAVPS